MSNINGRFEKGEHPSTKTEFKKGIIPWNVGKQHSEKTLKKMRESHRGKHHSPQTEFKKGEHSSPMTEFKKGMTSPNKGHHIFGEKSPHWKGGNVQYVCANCGKIFEKSKSYARCRAKYGCKRQYCCRDCYEEYRDHNAMLSNTDNWKLWRLAVYERDNFICKKCGRRGGELHPHHIKMKSKYPELMFDVNNGITWCKDCHMKSHWFRRGENHD